MSCGGRGRSTPLSAASVLKVSMLLHAVQVARPGSSPVFREPRCTALHRSARSSRGLPPRPCALAGAAVAAHQELPDDERNRLDPLDLLLCPEHLTLEVALLVLDVVDLQQTAGFSQAAGGPARLRPHPRRPKTKNRDDGGMMATRPEGRCCNILAMNCSPGS